MQIVSYATQGPETFPPGDAGWLNDKLPPQVAIGAMNIECGHAPKVRHTPIGQQ